MAADHHLDAFQADHEQISVRSYGYPVDATFSYHHVHEGDCWRPADRETSPEPARTLQVIDNARAATTCRLAPGRSSGNTCRDCKCEVHLPGVDKADPAVSSVRGTPSTVVFPPPSLEAFLFEITHHDQTSPSTPVSRSPHLLCLRLAPQPTKRTFDAGK